MREKEKLAVVLFFLVGLNYKELMLTVIIVNFQLLLALESILENI